MELVDYNNEEELIEVINKTELYCIHPNWIVLNNWPICFNCGEIHNKKEKEEEHEK